MSAVSPNAGPITGGRQITVTGTNFAGVTSVHFGSIAAPSYTVTSSTSLTAMTPSESYGVVDVTVTNGSGTSADNSGDNYTFTQVTLTNPGTQTSTAGVSVSLQLNAVAEPSGAITYSASNLPSGLSLNATTGLISGTPGTFGANSVFVTATSAQAMATQTFTWNILRGSSISLGATPSSFVSGQTITLSATISGQGFAVTSTDTSSDATTYSTSDGFYEAGSYANGTWSLSSVVFSGTDSSSDSFSQADTVTEAGVVTVSDSSSDTVSGWVNALAAALSSYSSGAGLSTASESVTETATDSLGASDSVSDSWSEQGFYSNGSFAFGSLVFQSSGSDSYSSADTSSDSFYDNGGDSYAANASASSASSMGLSSGWNTQSAAQSGTDAFYDQGTDAGSATDAGTDTFSTYFAGAYALNSYALSSVALSASSSESGTDQSAETMSNWGTDQGSNSFATGGAASNGNAGGSAGSQNSFSGGSSGTVGYFDWAEEIYADASSDSFSVSEQGTYGAQSFSFASVVFQAGAADTSSLYDHSTDSVGSYESDTGTGSSLISSSGGAGGAGQETMSASTSGVSAETVALTDNTDALYDVQDWTQDTVYEGGSFAGGCYSFSSVALNVVASEWDQIDVIDTQTLSTSSTDSNTSSSSDNSASGLSGSGAALSSDTMSGQSSGSGSSGGSGGSYEVHAIGYGPSILEGVSLSEQGSFANGSYSFSSIVLSSNFMDRDGAADSFNGNDSLSQNASFSDSSSNSGTEAFFNSLTSTAINLGLRSREKITWSIS